MNKRYKVSICHNFVYDAHLEENLHIDEVVDVLDSLFDRVNKLESESLDRLEELTGLAEIVEELKEKHGLR